MQGRNCCHEHRVALQAYAMVYDSSCPFTASCVVMCLLMFADVVYLDAKSDTYLEEVSSCNIFVRKGKSIKTPPLGGTILPGKMAVQTTLVHGAHTHCTAVQCGQVVCVECAKAESVRGAAVLTSQVQAHRRALSYL